MANPLAKLFVEIRAKGQQAVERSLDAVRKKLGENVTAAKGAEDGISKFTKKLEGVGKPAEQLQSRISALVGTMGAVVGAGVAAGLAINKLIEAFKSGKKAADEFAAAAFTGRDDVEDRFKRVRDRVEEISNLLANVDNDAQSLLLTGRTQGQLEEEKRALEQLFTSVEQQRKGLRNRQRRQEREEAEAAAKAEADAKTQAEAKERERALAKEKADRERFEQQEIEAIRKAFEERAKLDQKRYEDELARTRDLARAQIEAANATANALSALGGQQAQTLNQLIRKLDRIDQSIRRGGA